MNFLKYYWHLDSNVVGKSQKRGEIRREKTHIKKSIMYTYIPKYVAWSAHFGTPYKMWDTSHFVRYLWNLFTVKTLRNVRLSNFLTTSRNVRIASDQANYNFGRFVALFTLWFYIKVAVSQIIYMKLPQIYIKWIKNSL